MARFEWVYGDSDDRNALDVDLTPESEFGTVPTVGGLLPNWLLFMPRKHTTSISEMNSQSRARLLKHARAVMERICDHACLEQVAFFEHGAMHEGSATGCGVDHAHLHAVPLPFNLSRKFLQCQPLALAVNSVDPWDNVSASEYLLCIDGQGAYVATVTKPVSQSFRRMIAAEIGQHDKWNYNEFPFADNIAKTVQNFYV